MPDAVRRWRKKPVVVEAILWDGSEEAARALGAWSTPERPIEGCDVSQVVLITTLEGEMEGRLGDYIIRGVAGEVYPCKPDVFRRTYEPAPATVDKPEETA